MQLRDERVAAIYYDYASAEAERGVLQSEGIPAVVDPSAMTEAVFRDPEPHFRLLVSAADLERAREVLRGSGISDRELETLATGESGDSGEE